jgi:hyperosmotically inducible protein
MKRWIRISASAAVLSAVVFWSGTSFADRPDPWITTKVKLALIVSKDVGGTAINVDTYDGRVTLQGKVKSEQERDEAVRIAREIDGVRSVRNLLEVVPDGSRASYRVPDRQIRDDIARALQYDSRLRDSRITVASVHRGVVTLDGTASSSSDHLRAVQLARRVPGVRSVVSQVQVSSDRMADDEWQDDDDRGTTSSRASDTWITTQAKLRFMADPDVPAGDISVDSYRGRVTLFGMVPDQNARDQAEHIATDISGVRSVDNQLRVVPRSRQSAMEHSDRDIESAVRRRIANADMEGADIDVDVAGGIVRLAGTVKHPMDRYTAMSIAHSTRGVRAVRSDLRIERTRV